MTTPLIRFALLWLLLLAAGCASSSADERPKNGLSKHEQAVLVQYLEVVTPEVNATCSALEKVYDVRFGTPAAELGNARTAALRGGGVIGVRAPLRETEQPVVRPYALVEDIAAAVEAAEAAGAELALPPTEIPGRGKCAIYILGGIEYGLWQI
jgi:predicted enzyme related to lactoylglutathione lyase